MEKKFSKLNDVFNVSSEVISDDIDANIPSENVNSSSIIKDIESKNDIKRDYEYIRGNMYSIIEKGQEALNSVLELAQETDSPRAYEVVGQLIKNVSDSAEKLMDLQKKLKDIENNNSLTKSPTNVTNALFVGSTSELSKLIKGKLNNEDNK